MKLTIYYGGAEPMIAIGKNQCNLLDFAYRYQTWHTFKSDRATIHAINCLQSKGYIEVIADQFRYKAGVK